MTNMAFSAVYTADSFSR